jgi:hypothetical protein
MSTQDRNNPPKETNKEQVMTELPSAAYLRKLYEAAKADRQRAHSVQSGKCRISLRVI